MPCFFCVDLGCLQVILSEAWVDAISCPERDPAKDTELRRIEFPGGYAELNLCEKEVLPPSLSKIPIGDEVFQAVLNKLHLVCITSPFVLNFFLLDVALSLLILEPNRNLFLCDFSDFEVSLWDAC